MPEAEMEGTAMSLLPPQFSMSNSSPLANSGYELVSACGFDDNARWQVVGEDSQMLAALLNPGQSIMAEPGAMLSTSSFIEPSIDCGSAGLAVQRCMCAGESCCRTHYTNSTSGQQHITLSPGYPAKIVALKMDQYPNGFYLSPGAWMAGVGSSQEFSVKCAPSFLVGCCGVGSCCITLFKGSGDAFLNAGGTVLQRTLSAGEKVIVDTHALVAWETTVTMDVKCVGGWKMMCCGNSGMYNTELTGPGLVIVHSMGVERARLAFMRASVGQ